MHGIFTWQVTDHQSWIEEINTLNRILCNFELNFWKKFFITYYNGFYKFNMLFLLNIYIFLYIFLIFFKLDRAFKNPIFLKWMIMLFSRPPFLKSRFAISKIKENYNRSFKQE